VTRRRGSVGTSTSIVPVESIIKKAEEADRKPARSAAEVIVGDIRNTKRRKRMTPEYQAWLDRQAKKRWGQDR
jgi:hypothetical protein